MKNQTDIIKWGTKYLVANGYSIEHPSEIVLDRPWSTIIRFSTSIGNFYLKQTPSAISTEPQIIQLLADQFLASVPVVIASSDDLHCFLMRDAGPSLRQTLKAEFNADLLCQAITQYASLQRSTEDHVEALLKLGVPDWRLDKLPMLYDQILSQTDFLKADGVTDQELQTLRDLSPQFSAQCELLASYGIPETIGIPDFHDNNVLFDPKTKQMKFIDWGEASISHPFFSLYNCLPQSITHHGVHEGDQTYGKLQDACLSNWLGLTTKNRLLEVFNLSKQLRIIYGVLGGYRLMVSVDLQTLNTYHAKLNKSNQLARAFREYIASCGGT